MAEDRCDKKTRVRDRLILLFVLTVMALLAVELVGNLLDFRG